MNVQILHLSDIHAGQGELVDEDGKTHVPLAERSKQLERLTSYIGDLPRCPDYVVVSGDITIRGQADGFEIFKRWLLSGIAANILPPANRILIVPGNHDVGRRKRTTDDDKPRFKLFWDAFAKDFPHAHIPNFDPAPLTQPPVDLLSLPTVGGITTMTSGGSVNLKASEPFILDISRNLLIFAFNSAHGCGVPLDPNPEIVEPLSAIIKISSSDEHRKALHSVREHYLDSLIVDAGLLTAEQISYFSRLMGHLRRELGQKFDGLTKIAVLHHHIGHLWAQQLELKQFEATIDAAQLKRVLTENHFDIVLHGHKHTNHVGLDGSLIPVNRSERFSPLCVVAGGTIGGYPRTNDVQSFKLIDLPGEDGRRTAAVVREIPLYDSGNPALAMENDARIFNIPLADRFPRLHEFSTVKGKFDEEIIRLLAPEFNGGEGMRARDAVLASRDPNLFSTSLRYVCHGYLDSRGQKTYYEVIQSTERLQFRTVARLRWLITDVIGDLSQDDQNRVVILIGDLENTHYSEVITPGEVLLSIEKLRKDLSPAINAGLVEIRVYSFTQDETTRLTRIHS